jgi:hypothetical protein
MHAAAGLFCRTTVAPDGLTKLLCDVPSAQATLFNYTGTNFAIVRSFSYTVDILSFGDWMAGALGDQPADQLAEVELAHLAPLARLHA